MNEEKTVSIELTKKELYHLINDTIAHILSIKRIVFGDDWNLGTNITEVDVLTDEQQKELIDCGYYSRKELLDKLEQLEKDNFQELNCCG